MQAGILRGCLMEVCTSRFGTVEVSSADTICFPSGLVGFEDCPSWVLLMHQAGDSVIWLQSTQTAEVALPVVDPRTFVPEFTLQVEQSDWTPLGIRKEDFIQVLVTVARHEDSLRLNLLAPLMINCLRRLGRQVINTDLGMVDHMVWDSANALKKIA